MNDNDIKKEALIKTLRRLIEAATTTMQHVALDQEQSAASMLGVAAMYLSDAVGTLTGDSAAERDIHLTAARVLDRVYPERSALREEELS